MGAGGAVAVRVYPGRGRGRGGVTVPAPAEEMAPSIEPFEPNGLCLREGDRVILERNPVAPDGSIGPPPELDELTDPSREDCGRAEDEDG
jgi:hypothetical protein